MASPCTSKSFDSDDIPSYSGNIESRKRKREGCQREKDDCYGKDYKLTRGIRSKGESVSNWKIHKLDKIGLSYENQCSSIDDFFKIVEKFGFVSLSSDKERTSMLLAQLIKQTMEKTSFNMTRKENAEYCKGELEKCVEVTQEIRPVWDKLVAEGNLSWYHTQILVHLLNFYEQFTLFLRARCIAHTRPPVEANYTALLSSFMEIFLLRAKQGDELKNVISIGGVPTSAVPDLRLVNIGSLQDIERNLSLCVIAVVERHTINTSLFKVKRTARRGELHKQFDIHSALWDDVLAQHAGELLLEYQNTQYASKDCDTKVILGIICLETTLIFTWLELSDVHYADIKEGNFSGSEDEDYEIEKKDDLIKGRKSGVISYTKPYDYLLKDDREQILDFLYKLALQSEERFSADTKRKS